MQILTKRARFSGAAPGPLVVSLLLMGFAVSTESADNPKGEDPVKYTSALYLKHIGESDKPILPIVFSSQKPKQSELDSVLGKDTWKHATFVTIPAAHLQKMMARVHKLLGKVKDEDKGHAYGTFEITVTENLEGENRVLQAVGRFTRVLSKNETQPVLSAVEEVNEAADEPVEDLTVAVNSLKRRLGMEVTP